jgi:hypothetical protein
MYSCAYIFWCVEFLNFLLIMCSLQSLVEFFGTLSREWALECMKDLLLVNLRGNLQIIVQVHIVVLSNWKSI